MTLAHLSDLHIGYSPERLHVLIGLRDRLRALKVDHVLVTGDSTDHGRNEEYAQFKTIFADFIETNRLTILPGNHDRTGHEVARQMMGGRRVVIVHLDGLHLVIVDTTGPHNRFRLLSQGKIDQRVIDEVAEAVSQAAPGSTVMVALHHHLIRQPEEYLAEKLATFLRTPIATELRLGQDLIQRLMGRCDLILHGHRHVPLETRLADAVRPLTIYNAGSSTELGKFRLFRFAGGKLLGAPEWCI